MVALASSVSVPGWLVAVAWLSIGIGVLAAAFVAVDVVRRPPAMKVMTVVWPLTMLYGGLLALGYYLRFGRASHPEIPSRISDRVSVATGTSHCGAGCSLGDLVGEFLIAAVPAVAVALGWGSLYRDKVFAAWILDLVLAYLFGIVLQYFAIAPMRSDSPRANLIAAIKADTASILAWQVGMYSVMAILRFWVFPAAFGGPVEADSPVFWFGMQWAMLAGYAVAFPVNAVLIAKGVKEAM